MLKIICLRLRSRVRNFRQTVRNCFSMYALAFICAHSLMQFVIFAVAQYDHSHMTTEDKQLSLMLIGAFVFAIFEKVVHHTRSALKAKGRTFAVPPPTLSHLFTQFVSSILPRRMYQNGAVGPQECSICLSAFQDGESIVTLRCRHTFHAACIDTWLMACLRCGYCRTSVLI